MIIVLSGLPQIIISFTFSCTELATWTRHLLSIAYLLSFAPQLLGFMLFVLPSNNYFNEFQQTQLSKTRLFMFILNATKSKTAVSEKAIIKNMPS